MPVNGLKHHENMPKGGEEKQQIYAKKVV